MAFIINNSELISAASDYSKACDEYAKMMAKLKEELIKVTAEWKDEVADTWQNNVPAAITDLEKIEKNLNYNNNLLKEIATKATALQNDIKKEVNNLYLT